MRARPYVTILMALCIGLTGLAASGQITIDGTEIFFPDGSKQSTAPKDPSSRTVLVQPVIGAPNQSGTNLRNALSSITATADFPALVILEPGTYDVGNTFLNVPANVSIRGAGIDVTVIRGNPGTGFVIETQGENVISDLTVRHEGGSGLAQGRAIQASGTGDVRLHNVRAHVTGTFAASAVLTGVSTAGGCCLRMTDCLVEILNVTATNVSAVGVAVSSGTELDAHGIEVNVIPDLNNATEALNYGLNLQSGSNSIFVDASRIFVNPASSASFTRAINANSAGFTNIRATRIAASIGSAIFESATSIRVLGCEIIGTVSGSNTIVRQSVDSNFNDLNVN